MKLDGRTHRIGGSFDTVEGAAACAAAFRREHMPWSPEAHHGTPGRFVVNEAAVGAILIVFLLANLLIMSLKLIRLARGKEPCCAYHVRNDWMADAPVLAASTLLLAWIFLDYDEPWIWIDYLFTIVVAGNMVVITVCAVLTNRYLTHHSEQRSCRSGWHPW